MKRCSWCSHDPLYQKYHDEEWGVPTYDDRELFEFLTLEGAQAGLSWITILRKRANYKKAFSNFDPKKVAGFDAKKIEALLHDPGIVRNRLKIESTINNAKRVLEIQKEFGSFAAYVWAFVEGNPVVGNFTELKELPSQSDISKRMSNGMKKRGFRFVGPITLYSFMQACGLVNDHVGDCFRKAK